MTAKEIWYVWDGNLSRDMSFIRKVAKVSFSDGSFLIVDNQSSYRKMPVMWYLWGGWCDSSVRAYTLGETRERVECDYCIDGLFYYDDVREVKCHVCNGSGHVWRMGEKNEKI